MVFSFLLKGHPSILYKYIFIVKLDHFKVRLNLLTLSPKVVRVFLQTISARFAEIYNMIRDHTYCNHVINY